MASWNYVRIQSLPYPETVPQTIIDYATYFAMNALDYTGVMFIGSVTTVFLIVLSLSTIYTIAIRLQEDYDLVERTKWAVIVFGVAIGLGCFYFLAYAMELDYTNSRIGENMTLTIVTFT